MQEIGAREFLLGFVTVSILFSGSYIALVVTQPTHLPSSPPSIETCCITNLLASRIFFSLLLTSVGTMIVAMARKEVGYLFPVGLLVAGIAMLAELMVFPLS